MNRHLKTGLLAVLSISLLFFKPADEIYGSETEPVLSFSFDENDNNITAVTNTDGALEEIPDFDEYTYSTGQIGNCLYMDGTFGIKLNTGRLNTQNYTICFWVKPVEINAHTPILSIVRGEFSELNYTTVLVDENWLQPNITSIYTDENGSSSFSAGISGALTPDTWTHIAIVVDTSSSEEEFFDKMLLYVDGEYACDGLVLTNLCNSTSDFWLGIDTFTDAFNGYMDELYIFNNALSAEDILSLYNNDTDINDEPDNNHGNNSHDNKDNHSNHGQNSSEHGGQSGNIFDDIVKLDQGSLPDTDNSSLSTYLNPGLAAGMEYKTDAYADIAFLFSIIFALISLCCFFTYRKKKHNQY